MKSVFHVFLHNICGASCTKLVFIRGQAIIRVQFVCVCVCLSIYLSVQAMVSEPLKLGTSFSVYTYIFSVPM